jgi:hypothetical protein
MSRSWQQDAVQRSTNIARYVTRLLSNYGWKSQMHKSRISESWYIRLRHGKRHAMLRISFHGSKKGWKTVNSIKQAEEFARRLIKGTS